MAHDDERPNRRDFMVITGAGLAGMSLLSSAGCDDDETPVPDAGLPFEAEQEVELEIGWIEQMIDGHRCRLRSYGGTVPGTTITTYPGQRLTINVRNRLTDYDSSAWNGDHNVPHKLNTTNLHVHGMEVVPHLFDPVGTSDPMAEMIHIDPGEDYTYTFDIPADQPPGLFWYHPHHHGSTAVQAVSGMAGAIIVRGAIDEVPEIAAAREQVIACNDIGLFQSEDDDDVWVYEPVQNTIWQTFGATDIDGNTLYVPGSDPPVQAQVTEWDPSIVNEPPALPGNRIGTAYRGGFTTGDYKLRFYMTNGQAVYREDHDPDSPTAPTGTALDDGIPVFTQRPGEVVRYRMLNANSDDLMPVAVEGLPIHLIAFDGVNFPAPRLQPAPGDDGYQFLLSPANRAEFLVRAEVPGRHRIVQRRQTAQFLESDARTIAIIEIAGEAMVPPMGIPAELPMPQRHYPLITEDEIACRRTIEFSMVFPGVANPYVGLDFMVDGELYDEQQARHTVRLGTAEEWTIRSPHHDAADGDHDAGPIGPCATASTSGEMPDNTEGHPFHIHVNSFEVVSVCGTAQPPGTIMDTIWVPKGGEVVIRTRFREWLGKSVYHCHILPHEDTGMMANFIIADGESNCPG